MTPEMREILDKLNQVSVVHYDVESAASTVNEIYKDANKWWNEKNRKEIIQSVRSILLLSSGSLINDWAAELKSL